MQSKGSLVVDFGNSMRGYCKASELQQQIQQVRANSKSLLPRKCEIKGCNAELTYERNFRNVFCWNCLYKKCIDRGNNCMAQQIADDYL